MSPTRPRKWQHLATLVSGYLHQDFTDEYGSAPGAVQARLREMRVDEARELSAEWRRFLNLTHGMDSQMRARILRELAGGAWAPGDEREFELVSALLIEVILTAFFLIVILGSTHGRVPAGFAPIAIGLALTLIHLISIPVTNTSVNPARSTGQALFVGGWALQQLWLAPILGGAIGAVIWKIFGEEEKAGHAGSVQPAQT